MFSRSTMKTFFWTHFTGTSESFRYRSIAPSTKLNVSIFMSHFARLWLAAESWGGKLGKLLSHYFQSSKFHFVGNIILTTTSAFFSYFQHNIKQKKATQASPAHNSPACKQSTKLFSVCFSHFTTLTTQRKFSAAKCEKSFGGFALLRRWRTRQFNMLR